VKFSGRKLVARPHQQRGSGRRQQEGDGLDRPRQSLQDDEAVDDEDEAGGVAEQAGIGELGQADPDMPGGEVHRQEQPARGDDRHQAPRRRLPPRLLPPRQQSEEGNGQRQPPEAGGDRADVRQPDHPRAEGEDEVAEDQRGKGETSLGRRG
jgi:hypothetical protein